MLYLLTIGVTVKPTTDAGGGSEGVPGDLVGDGGNSCAHPAHTDKNKNQTKP